MGRVTWGFPRNCIAGIPLDRRHWSRSTADDQDRPMRFVQHTARDAAEERARDRAMPARTDNDEVRVDRVGARDDLVDRVASKHRRLRFDSTLLGERYGFVQGA